VVALGVEDEFHLKEFELRLFNNLTVLSEPKNWAFEDLKSLNLRVFSVL
jgi:hypothetical protein